MVPRPTDQFLEFLANYLLTNRSKAHFYKIFRIFSQLPIDYLVNPIANSKLGYKLFDIT